MNYWYTPDTAFAFRIFFASKHYLEFEIVFASKASVYTDAACWGKFPPKPPLKSAGKPPIF
jgi:hypothetical protein